jgi:hypothetical protein
MTTNNNNNNVPAGCPTTTTSSFLDTVLDYGSAVLKNAGLFAIIFVILFVRENYLDVSSIPNVIAFILLCGICFALTQFFYADINGFVMAGIGVSAGMSLFKDQFSTIFINSGQAKLS